MGLQYKYDMVLVVGVACFVFCLFYSCGWGERFWLVVYFGLVDESGVLSSSRRCWVACPAFGVRLLDVQQCACFLACFCPVCRDSSRVLGVLPAVLLPWRMLLFNIF